MVVGMLCIDTVKTLTEIKRHVVSQNVFHGKERQVFVNDKSLS